MRGRSSDSASAWRNASNVACTGLALPWRCASVRSTAARAASGLSTRYTSSTARASAMLSSASATSRSAATESASPCRRSPAEGLVWQWVASWIRRLASISRAASRFGCGSRGRKPEIRQRWLPSPSALVRAAGSNPAALRWISTSLRPPTRYSAKVRRSASSRSSSAMTGGVSRVIGRPSRHDEPSSGRQADAVPDTPSNAASAI